MGGKLSHTYASEQSSSMLRVVFRRPRASFSMGLVILSDLRRPQNDVVLLLAL